MLAVKDNIMFRPAAARKGENGEVCNAYYNINKDDTLPNSDEDEDDCDCDDSDSGDESISLFLNDEDIEEDYGNGCSCSYCKYSSEDMDDSEDDSDDEYYEHVSKFRFRIISSLEDDDVDEGRDFEDHDIDSWSQTKRKLTFCDVDD